MFSKLIHVLAIIALLSTSVDAAQHKVQYSQRASLVSKQHRRALKLKRQEDAQTALILDASQIQPNLALTGQETPAVGQVESLTSTNNFINFCLTQNVPLTNGRQSAEGTCNPTPIGRIIPTDKMPASKFTFPPNGGTIKANEAFDITMAVQNMITGNKVNTQKSWYAAPQQLNGGVVLGYNNVVVETISSLDSTDVNDASKFTFFKAIGEAAADGVVKATVTGGLPVGTYKLSSINSASNGQPVLVAVAQHGSLDDCIFFTVTEDGESISDPASSSIAAITTATDSAAQTTVTQSVSVTETVSISESASASETATNLSASVTSTESTVSPTESLTESSASASTTSSQVSTSVAVSSPTTSVKVTQSVSVVTFKYLAKLPRFTYSIARSRIEGVKERLPEENCWGK
ncbi:hypothetical protein FRC02_002180 [Tulasnella sp. 418]|nr:hypothetical protein FRC02_002180 [Tulasnella sp. 418]